MRICPENKAIKPVFDMEVLMQEVCDIEFERSVNQTLWEAVMGDEVGQHGDDFDNGVFSVRPYRWTDEDDNDWHFYHRPSGFKLQWYKYPLRCPMVNMNISHKQFLDILRDCANSLHPQFTHEVDYWWE